MTDPVESPDRRAFLGYTGATALLTSRFAAAWAGETGKPGAADTERALRDLAERLEGDLLLPGDALFEPVRTIGWNVAVPERRPDPILGHFLTEALRGLPGRPPGSSQAARTPD